MYIWRVLYSFFFFFLLYCDHRDLHYSLHSFPTRRSSDLRGLDEKTLAVFDSWQWPAEKKLAACDLLLDNDGGLDKLASEAERLQQWAAERSQKRNEDFAVWMENLWPKLAEEFGHEEEPA